MAAVLAEDVRATFLFLGDFNGYHQEWLGSKTTNRHGVAAFDFATASGFEHLVVGPTHARGGTLNLLTDVPDLVRVAKPVLRYHLTRVWPNLFAKPVTI